MSIFYTPLGLFKVMHDEHFIISSSFTQDSGTVADHHLSCLVQAELSAYFSDPHHRFQLPLKPQGSPYQLNVWNALLVIPTGRTLTYGELAQKLQSGPRAIGQACKRNPLPLFIPCHRIVGKSDLGGYMGNPNALPYKSSLLAHETQRYAK